MIRHPIPVMIEAVEDILAVLRVMAGQQATSVPPARPAAPPAVQSIPAAERVINRPSVAEPMGED